MKIIIRRLKAVTVRVLLDRAASAMERSLAGDPIRYASAGEILSDTGIKIGAWEIEYKKNKTTTTEN